MYANIYLLQTQFGSRHFATKEDAATYCYRAVKAVGTKAEASTGLMLLLAKSMDNVKITKVTRREARDGNEVRGLVNEFNLALGNLLFQPTDELKEVIRANVKQQREGVMPFVPRHRTSFKSDFQAEPYMVNKAVEDKVRPSFFKRVFVFLLGVFGK